MRDIKQWTRLFKGLANRSRLQIIILLSKNRELTVGDIARQIHVSFPGTSKHLSQLVALDVLDHEGKAKHVFYSLRTDIDSEIRSILNKFIP